MDKKVIIGFVLLTVVATVAIFVVNVNDNKEIVNHGDHTQEDSEAWVFTRGRPGWIETNMEMQPFLNETEREGEIRYTVMNSDVPGISKELVGAAGLYGLWQVSLNRINPNQVNMSQEVIDNLNEMIDINRFNYRMCTSEVITIDDLMKSNTHLEGEQIQMLTALGTDTELVVVRDDVDPANGTVSIGGQTIALRHDDEDVTDYTLYDDIKANLVDKATVSVVGDRFIPSTGELVVTISVNGKDQKARAVIKHDTIVSLKYEPME